MADLAKEYTDTKDVKHKVEHFVLSADNKNSREQILEELFHALAKPRKHIST